METPKLNTFSNKQSILQLFISKRKTMKYFFYLFISFLCLMAMSSCEDNGATGRLKQFFGTKITIYVSHSGDTNDFVKNSEYYFDGDVVGAAKRCYWMKYGISNFSGMLRQERSNVPLPLFKFGCLTKNIEYSNDSTVYSTINYDYDAQGFMSQGTVVYNEASNNKNSSALYFHSGDNLTILKQYQENILTIKSRFFYNYAGLCTTQIDSNMVDSIEIAIIKRNYNDMSQVINYSKSWGGTDKHVVEYFYDNEGNNIKQLEYTVNNSDTTDVEVWNWVMYKGYRIESDKIERFIFDSNDNIIGYINPDFGNTRYKIEYMEY